MMESIFLEGFTDDERHAGINKIRHSVSKYGDIVDFHFYRCFIEYDYSY
jgi:hypothetical protein